MRPIQPNGLAAALANNISLVNKWNGLNQKERHPFDFLPMLPGAFPLATITMAVKRGPNFFNFFYPPKYNKHLLPSPASRLRLPACCIIMSAPAPARARCDGKPDGLPKNRVSPRSPPQLLGYEWNRALLMANSAHMIAAFQTTR